MSQRKNAFDVETWKKIGKGAGIAGGGAAVVYLLTAVGTLDWGEYTPAITAVAAVLLNAVREWRKGE